MACDSIHLRLDSAATGLSHPALVHLLLVLTEDFPCGLTTRPISTF